MDVVDAFGGVVDSYSAVSGDDTVVTAAVEGSVVTFTGVAAGSATVSVTATNAGGSVSQDVAVTVVLPAAPTVGVQFGDYIVTVGETAEFDLSLAFEGVVESYDASLVAELETQSAADLLTVVVNGSEATLDALGAGTVIVRVTATNAGGSASQTFSVSVVAGSDLRVNLGGPTYCLASEGRTVGRTRTGVGEAQITYSVAGGTAPYTVTSPSAFGVAKTAASGVISVNCARDGIDLRDVSAIEDVVQSGPKSIQIDVTDANGATVSEHIVVEVAEIISSLSSPTDLLRGGLTYGLGTTAQDPTQWVSITLPPGLDLRLVESLGEGVVVLEHPSTGSRISFRVSTGQEVARILQSAAGSSSQSGSNSQSPTNRSPADAGSNKSSTLVRHVDDISSLYDRIRTAIHTVHGWVTSIDPG